MLEFKQMVDKIWYDFHEDILAANVECNEANPSVLHVSSPLIAEVISNNLISCPIMYCTLCGPFRKQLFCNSPFDSIQFIVIHLFQL